MEFFHALGSFIIQLLKNFSGDKEGPFNHGRWQASPARVPPRSVYSLSPCEWMSLCFRCSLAQLSILSGQNRSWHKTGSSWIPAELGTEIMETESG